MNTRPHTPSEKLYIHPTIPGKLFKLKQPQLLLLLAIPHFADLLQDSAADGVHHSQLQGPDNRREQALISSLALRDQDAFFLQLL